MDLKHKLHLKWLAMAAAARREKEQERCVPTQDQCAVKDVVAGARVATRAARKSAKEGIMDLFFAGLT